MRKKKQSANVAKERLQLLLSHATINQLSPEALKELQSELLAVISKYVEIDQKDAIISIGQQDDLNLLEIDVPLKRQKNEKP